MRAEAEVAGAPTGGMDQTVSLFAQADSALLLDCRDWSTRQVGWDPAASGLTLLVVDTRASHSLSDGGYAARRADCETAAEALGVQTLRDVDDQEAALRQVADLPDGDRLVSRVRHVFTEIDRVREAVAPSRGRGLRSARPVVHGLARVVARRLRGLLRGARRGRRRRARRTAPWAPG